MKLLFLILFVLFAQTTAISQTLPDWFRVYTFDDKSTIEINTNYVMFSTDKTGRVQFRWTYIEPQNLSRDLQVKYQSILQEVAFDCENRKYNIYETEWFDGEGKLLQTTKAKPDEEKKSIRSSGIMTKLYPQACKLINLRKREPALEQ
jgi:hypothetical protein